MKLAVTPLLAALFTAGCTHTIEYKVTDEEHWQGERIDRSLAVVPFTDATTAQTQRVIKIEKFNWRANYREGYAYEEIANGVTAMVAQHLNHSGLFAAVAVSTNLPEADWQLSGNITEYVSMARVHELAEGTFYALTYLGSLAGAGLGLAFTAGAKTEVDAAVELREVALKDTSTGEIVWQGDVRASTNYVAHWTQADGQAVFRHADECLKRAVNELIQRIGNHFESQREK